MNGLTFLNAGFWPWLLALGVPVLIHLLTRRTRRTTVLPTFQFLQKSLAQQSRLFRWRHWLLLTLRLLLLFLLVLTFLKPTIPAPLASAGGQKRAVLLILDTSLSMGYTQGGISSLARARAQVMTLLDDLRADDAANVILAASAPRSVLPKPGSDFGMLRQAVKSAEATPERGDMAAAIAAAAEQLGKEEAPRKELWLASDFQRTNWADVKFDALSADVKLIFLHSDSQERPNAAVTGLKLRPAMPSAGEEAGVVAEIWNGTQATRTLTVTLTIQRDDPTGTAATALPASPPVTLAIPRNATGTATFPITFPDAGRYRITARLPADNLPADDARTLVADLRHRQTVLFLTDAPLHGDSGAYFLLRALNPTPDQPGGVRAVAKHAAELSETDLKTCDAVLLDEVTTLPADRLPLLARYVMNGGALIVFLTGPRIQAQMQALASLAKGGDGLPFLPQLPIDVRSRGKGYVTLTEARYDSPLLKIFKDPAAADLGKIHFMRFFITNEPDPRAEVLLKFEDGTPAAARRNFGGGSVLLCNFSPDPKDSDLARQEVFPPLLHEFLKGMTAREGDRREFAPGDAASTTIDPAQAQSGVAAFSPSGEPERVTVDRTSGGVIVERVESLGFHTIVANGQIVGVLAVNPHPDESVLDALDPRELESKRSQRPSYVVNRTGSAALELERLRHGVSLWPLCLVAALITLLLEQAVATFSGRLRLRKSRS